MEMREMGIGRVKTLGIAVGLVAVLLWAPAAQASYDPISSGTTKLALDKGFLASMKKVGVKVTVKAPAKLKGSTVILPVIGGKSDPTIAKAELEQQYKPSDSHARAVEEEKVKANYAIAKERCDDQTGADKSACQKQASADEAKGKADIKAMKKM